MSCLYNKNLILQIYNQRGFIEERDLQLIITNNHDILQLKIRDPTEYTFNYTENMDLGDYEIMRVKQDLDINFAEFISNLLDLLQQVQRKDMYLKCETKDDLCTLMFYNKSKIKSIVYLTVDLHQTNQKDILNELICNLNNFKEYNEKLKLKVESLKKVITDKDNEIKDLNNQKIDIRKEFFNVSKEVQNIVEFKTKDIIKVFSKRIGTETQKVQKLTEYINNIKKQAVLTSNSNDVLSKNFENLKLENRTHTELIIELKQKNYQLEQTVRNLESGINELNYNLKQKDYFNKQLESKNDELRSDMEKATIILAKKQQNIDELQKDLVQANQMLVNFNYHYDTKVQSVEKLETALENKNQIIMEVKEKFNELQKEFETYKLSFNPESYENMKHNLITSQITIKEMEETIRKVNKINALLSEKVKKLDI